MDHRISGGFFWFQNDPVIEDRLEEYAERMGVGPPQREISRCVVMVRPKWYQIEQWIEVARSVLHLPHD